MSRPQKGKKILRDVRIPYTSSIIISGVRKRDGAEVIIRSKELLKYVGKKVIIQIYQAEPRERIKSKKAGHTYEKEDTIVQNI